MLAKRVRSGEMELAGVRLDSGDLVGLSQQVRSLLPGVGIFASGDLDEWEIAKLKAADACIDGYGMGTRLVTGTPVNGVYKLVEIDGIPVMKQSTGKLTYPGRKQIFRCFAGKNVLYDRLGLVTETADEGQPLLQLVVKQGNGYNSQNLWQKFVNVRLLQLPVCQIKLESGQSHTATTEISPTFRKLTEQTQQRHTA